MSKLKLLSGTVSHIKHFSETSGSVYRGEGSIGTSHRISFRVNNHPAWFYGTPNLDEGEFVTLVGMNKGVDFTAFALRNDSTNITYFYNNYHALGKVIYGFGGFLIYLGIILLFSNTILAIFELGIGIWMILARRKHTRTINKLLLKSQ
jgi:hypothetical protein